MHHTFFRLSIFAVGLIACFFAKANIMHAATLSLSPSSGSIVTDNILTVQVLLNTAGVAIDGVDLIYLNYDPSILQVIDESPTTSGTQITSGGLMGITLINTVDSVNGKILFSQVNTGGTSYSNTSNQTFATIRFRAIKEGSVTIFFNFTPGSTSDTNVSTGGRDILTSVVNGTYTVVKPFDFSITAGANTSTIQGKTATTSLSAVLISGNTQSVSFFASGLPTGASVDFAPSSCNPPCTTIATISTLGTTPPGDYSVLITGQSGSLTHTSSFTLTLGADVVAPAPIMTFATTTILSTSADFSWIAPGNDGTTGTAAIYDIRYATTLITDTTWDSAALVLGEPAPAVSGTLQTYTLVGLAPNTTYYVGIKTIDGAGNISPLSNVLSFSTPSSPVVPPPPPPPPPPPSSGGGGGGSGGGSSSGGSASSGSGGGGIVLPSSGGGSSSGGSEFVSASTTPIASSTPVIVSPIRHLTSVKTGSSIIFTWINPSDADYVRTRIVKNLLHAPQNPTDGVIIYEGTTPFFRDSLDAKLLQQNYFYAFFTFNRNLNFSIPVHTSLSPSLPSSIDVLTLNLYRGLKHPEVSLLQTFLIAKGYLDSDNVTGFFGMLTETATRTYQCIRNIVCEGTPADTGYGIVGPRTRALINQERFADISSTSRKTLIEEIKAKILELQAKLQELLKSRSQ